MAQQEPHFILYVDVNKTVIMHDPVQGKGLHHILNDLLTERALGRVVDDDSAQGEKQWAWNGRSVVHASPGATTQTIRDGSSHDDDSVHDLDAQLVSYGRFLRAKYPMSEDPVVAKQHKKMRKVFRQDFTQPGNAGEGLAAEHAALLAKLRLPTAPSSVSNGHIVGQNDKLSAATFAAAGLDDAEYLFIVPSFFRFVQYLHARGSHFNLIFRTYGDDLARIAQEFNCFCEGKHPFFPLTEDQLMDGSHGGVDRRMHLQPEPAAPGAEASSSSARFGTFFRTDSCTALVLGTFEQPRGRDASLSFYDAQADKLQIVLGLSAIHEFLTHTWQSTQSTLAIRDFYPFWFSNCEDARTGKLMTMDPEDRSVHVLFFDDNILPQEPHIVDARDVRNGNVLDFDNVTKGTHLMRVEPLNAIQNANFFIECFHASLEKRKQKQLQKEALELM
uniref:Uncharacterized protein n=1 Tax=Globisporangium ultimum (strain ATCC 200006 / CBS 805.95 / DAOM BR144) TaxID=431595 RepID=K3WBH3_GLOUD